MVASVVFDVVKQYAIPIYTNEFVADCKNFQNIKFKISISLFYETLIMIIRRETIRFAKEKAKRYRAEENRLTMEVNKLNTLFNKNRTQAHLASLEEAQSKLENMRRSKTQGSIIRSRVRWFEEGEKCSKYFLSLEKRNAMRKSIQSLKVDDCIITKKEEILQHFSENLQTKYTSSKAKMVGNSKEYLKNNIKRKLSNEQKKALDEPLTLQELKIALMGMKKGRSPGTNGFTSDFF